MATARQVARSRALKLAVALCFVSAVAFLLGQGVAAFRATGAQTPTTSQQTIERVSGAQGTIPAPPAPAQSAAASTTTPSGPAATTAPVALSANLTRATPAGHVDHARGKDKAHAKHKGAAGDSSHGGLAHGGDASQPAHQPDAGRGGHSDGHGGGHGK